MKIRGFSWWAAAGAALLISLACLAAGVLEKRMVDFEVNDQAARRIPRGETLYRIEDGHYQFKYPPAAALVYLPLTLLPPATSKAAWLFLSLLAIGVSLVLSFRLAGRNGPKSWLLQCLPVLILSKYLLRELELGQINVFILALMLFSARLLARAESENRPGLEAAAGCLWGVATAIKPYTLIFLPYLAVRGKFRALASGAAVLAASFILPGFYYGFRGNVLVFREWIQSLTASTPLLLTSQDNISAFAFAAKHSGNPTTAFVLGLGLTGCLAVFMLFVILKGRSLAGSLALEVALLLLLTPLISPLGWDYTLLAGLPAVVFLIRYFTRFSKAGRVLLAGNLALMPLFLYDLFGPGMYGVLMRACLPAANALILSAFLAALRRREVC